MLFCLKPFLFLTVKIHFVKFIFICGLFVGSVSNPSFVFFDNRLQKMKVNNNVGFTLDHKRPVDYI